MPICPNLCRRLFLNPIPTATPQIQQLHYRHATAALHLRYSDAIATPQPRQSYATATPKLRHSYAKVTPQLRQSYGPPPPPQRYRTIFSFQPSEDPERIFSLSLTGDDSKPLPLAPRALPARERIPCSEPDQRAGEGGRGQLNHETPNKQ